MVSTWVGLQVGRLVHCFLSIDAFLIFLLIGEIHMLPVLAVVGVLIVVIALITVARVIYRKHWVIVTQVQDPGYEEIDEDMMAQNRPCSYELEDYFDTALYDDAMSMRCEHVDESTIGEDTENNDEHASVASDVNQYHALVSEDVGGYEPVYDHVECSSHNIQIVAISVNKSNSI